MSHILRAEDKIANQALESYHLNMTKWEYSDYKGVDLIKLGFPRAMKVMRLILTFALNFYYKVSNEKNLKKNTDAEYINSGVSCANRLRHLNHLALQVFARCESQSFIANTTPHQREEFIYKGGILYYSGRLENTQEFKAKDLDFDLVPDSWEFQGLVPILLAKSPLLFAYAMYVHNVVVPHAGNETVLLEIMKKFYIVGNKRYIITKIRNDCTKCRIMAKKTVELEMAKIHPAKLDVAPVFYNVQMDIAYGPFNCQAFKKTRSIKTIYGLVIVCILTGATNILVLEGIETQDIVSALERHGTRYGYPAEVFVDSGSQLGAIDQAEATLRDANTFLYNSRGTIVTVSCPKAHESRGKVERKIQAIRETLKKLDINCYDPVSAIMWETIFAKVANALDNLPMAIGDDSARSDLAREILTPNRLKLGRNNNRSLEGSIEFTTTALPSDILNRNRRITAGFLKLIMDRAHQLIYSWRGKWNKSDDRIPVVDDIVLFRFSDNESLREQEQWKLGRVVSTTPTRSRIMYPAKSQRLEIPKMKFLERSHRDVVILAGEDDPDLNSEEYFQQIISKNG